MPIAVFSFRRLVIRSNTCWIGCEQQWLEGNGKSARCLGQHEAPTLRQYRPRITHRMSPKNSAHHTPRTWSRANDEINVTVERQTAGGARDEDHKLQSGDFRTPRSRNTVPWHPPVKTCRCSLLSFRATSSRRTFQTCTATSRRGLFMAVSPSAGRPCQRDRAGCLVVGTSTNPPYSTYRRKSCSSSAQGCRDSTQMTSKT